MNPHTPAIPLNALPQVIDNTIISTFRNCQHKAKWEFGHHLRPAAFSVDLHAGICFAKGVETLYRATYLEGLTPVAALLKARFTMTKAWGGFVAQKATNKTLPAMLDALESYAEEYHPPSDYIEPAPQFKNPFEYSFGIELTKEFLGYEVPMHPASGEPFIYAGKFDMIGQHAGLLRIRDDKTASALGATWPNQWTLRSQLIGYCAAMQFLGHDVDTCELRGVAILKASITHAKAVKTYPKIVIERWKWQLSRDIANLVRAAKNNEWEFNFSNECAAYGGCAFLDLCKSVNPDAFFSSYSREPWNPLSPAKETLNAPVSASAPIFVD